MVNIMAKIIILGLFAVGIAFAQPSIPSGAVAYANLTLNESWSSIASQYVQQNITLNESNYTSYINYNGSIANFEFTYANGTVIPSWIESNQSNQTLVWLNITNTTTNVYLDFFNMTTNMLNSTGTSGIGEAPQLSSTYAEYDDGASVFNYYQRWGGLSALPTNWETIGNSGQTPVVTFNSIYTNIEPTSTVAWQGVALPSAYYPSSFSAGNVIDMYGEIYQGSTVNSQPIVGFDGWSGPGTNFDTLMFGAMGYGPTLSSSPTYGIGVSGYSNWGSTGLTETTNNQVYSLSYLSAASFGMQVNYANPVIETVGSQANPNNYFLFGVAYIGDIANVYWLRTRAYPPNGVMPSASFSSLS